MNAMVKGACRSAGQHCFYSLKGPIRGASRDVGVRFGITQLLGMETDFLAAGTCLEEPNQKAALVLSIAAGLYWRCQSGIST